MTNIISTDNSVLITKLVSCDWDLKVNQDSLVFELITQNTSSIFLSGGGTANSPLLANVQISSAGGNLLSLTDDGLYVEGVEPIGQTLSYNTTTKVLTLSPDGNSVTLDADPAPQTLSFNTSTYILGISDGNTVDLTVLHDVFSQTPLSVIDTNSIDFTTSGTNSHTLTGSVRIDGTTSNLITVSTNGLLVAPITSIPNTPLSVTSTSSILFAVNGTDNHHLTGSVKVSAIAGNILSISVDGLYVPTQTFTETDLTTYDSNGIYFTTSGAANHNLTANVKISAVPGNVIVLGTDGLYAPAVVVAPQINSDWTATSGIAEILHKPTAGTGITFAGNTITNTAPDQTVALGSGTAISVTGTYPNFTITNTAPDQTVVLNNGTGISVSGTYPNFTITNTTPGTTYTAGTGISVSGSVITNTAPNQAVSISAGTGISIGGSYPNFSVTNTAPDQTVALTAGTNISITGSYPNFTINSTGGTGSVTSVNLTAGTGISVSGGPITTSGSINVVNTAPDQTVVLTAGSNISISGTYPNFTIGATGLATVATSGLYSDLSGTPVFSNGIIQSGTSVKLGGTLTANTTTTASAYFLNYINTSDIGIGGTFGNGGTWIMTGSSTSTSDTQVGYAGLYGAMGAQKTASNTLDDSSVYAGVWGASYFNQTSAITSGVLASFSSWSLFANTGSVGSVAGLYIRQPKQQLTPATTFSGTCTNYYGILIEAISTSSIIARFTNKFALYQAGTSDTSRFYGALQTTSGSVTTISDERVKTNIVDFTRGLSDIEKIKTHNFSYVWKQEQTVTGILAQELELVLPEAVRQEATDTVDGTRYEDFRTVDTSVLVYTLINAVKELSAKVKVLENK